METKMAPVVTTTTAVTPETKVAIDQQLMITGGTTATTTTKTTGNKRRRDAIRDIVLPSSIATTSFDSRTSETDFELNDNNYIVVDSFAAGVPNKRTNYNHHRSNNTTTLSSSSNMTPTTSKRTTNSSKTAKSSKEQSKQQVQQIQEKNRYDDDSHPILLMLQTLGSDDLHDIRSNIISLSDMLLLRQHHQNDNRLTFTQLGGHLAIVMTMRKWSDIYEIQRDGCRLIRYASIDDEESAMMSFRVGSIPTILSAMKTFANVADMQSEGCECLCSIIRTATTTTIGIVSSNSGISSSSGNNSENMKNSSNKGILVSESFIKKHHGLKVVATAMKNFQSTYNVIKYSCLLLCNIIDAMGGGSNNNVVTDNSCCTNSSSSQKKNNNTQLILLQSLKDDYKVNGIVQLMGSAIQLYNPDIDPEEIIRKKSIFVLNFLY